jgi:hypothetical protein
MHAELATTIAPMRAHRDCDCDCDCDYACRAGQWLPTRDVVLLQPGRPGAPDPIRDKVLESEDAWLLAARDARSASGTHTAALLVDPWERTVMEVAVPLGEYSAVSRPPCRGMLATVTPQESAMASLIEGIYPDPIACSVRRRTSCMAERACDGAYICVTAVSTPGMVPRDPGFELFGKPIYGAAVLTAGVQLYSPVYWNVLERGVPLHAADLPPVRWLTPREVRETRRARIEAAHAEMAAVTARETQAGGEVVIVQEGTPVLSCDTRAGSCKVCRKRAELKCCSRCKAAHYCSPACQLTDWRAGHRAACKGMQGTVMDG